MSVIVLPSLIHRVRAIRAEVNGSFDALELAVNTTKLSPDQVVPGAIQHRHLKHPPRVGLATEFETYASSLTINSNPWTVGPHTFYVIDNSRLTLYVPHAELNNQYSVDEPVASVTAIYHQVDGFDTNAISEVTLGWSNDGGATWHPSVEDRRSCGYVGGGAPAYFDGPQDHYLTGIPGWMPPSEPFDRGVQLVSVLGGAGERLGPSLDLGDGIMVAVMVNSTSIGARGRLWGRIQLNSRWLDV